MTKEVRVRFAPSPTGPLHIGGVRTALYNYLFARTQGGKFIVRIEDTDSQRYVPGAEQYIFESLRWCGLLADEGVEQGGPHAPYRQSERREIYLEYALRLVEAGHAYYAFDTPEELDRMRAEAESAGLTFAYDHRLRERLHNSLTLSTEEVAARIASGQQWVIRFRMPAGEKIHMSDLIRREITVDSSTLDDKVLYKSADNLPTYHLANIVDDHLMEITHVIRGEEWLPSLPLHYKLYQAFGWKDTMPQFAHLPLILKPTGKGKLSKRDGDAMGFPVFPLEWKSPEGDLSRGYREDGYFPEAFINMLALLGWNPGDDREIFSMEELIKAFSLDKVGKSGSRFDPAKALWFNTQYLHTMPDQQLVGSYVELVEANGFKVSNDVALEIVGMIKPRATFLRDLWELSEFFFRAPETYDEKAVKKFWKEDNPTRIADLALFLDSQSDFSSPALHDNVMAWIEKHGYPTGQIMNCLRLALVGSSTGPDLFAICRLLGPGEVLHRINLAIKKLR